MARIEMPTITNKASEHTASKNPMESVGNNDRDEPPKNCRDFLSRLYAEFTNDSNVRYKAEDEEVEESGKMSNTHFVNLCKTNNTGWFELYFDLIFVAFILVNGNLLKSISHDTSSAAQWRHFWDSSLLFFLGWISWSHLNMYMASFEAVGSVRLILFTLSAMMMALASVLVVKDDSVGGFESGIRKLNPNILLLFTRLCYLALYAITFQFFRKPFLIIAPNDDEDNDEIDENEKEEDWVDISATLKIYIGGFLLSSTLILIGLFLPQDDGNTRAAVVTIALLIELSMYPLALFHSIHLSRDTNDKMTDDETSIVTDKVQRFEHKELIERNELWIVIVTGEAVISIVSASTDDSYVGTYGVNYFITLGLCILIVIQLLRIYFVSQPEWEIKFDQHATMTSPLMALMYIFCHFFMSLGIFMAGVAMKFFIKNEYKIEKVKRVYALLLCCGMTLALVSINLARSTHTWQQEGGNGRPKIPVLWMENGRRVLLTVHNALTFTVLGLGWSVNNDKIKVTNNSTGVLTTEYTYEDTGSLTPTILLLIVLIIMIVIGYIEALLEPPFYLLQRFKAQLDEDFESSAAEKQRMNKLYKREKAHHHWSLIRRFVQKDRVRKLSEKEQILWNEEIASYWSFLDNYRREYDNRCEIYRQRIHEHKNKPENILLAKCAANFWARKENLGLQISFGTLVHSVMQHGYGQQHHHTRARGLGAQRPSAFIFDFQRPLSPDQKHKSMTIGSRPRYGLSDLRHRHSSISSNDLSSDQISHQPESRQMPAFSTKISASEFPQSSISPTDQSLQTVSEVAVPTNEAIIKKTQVVQTSKAVDSGHEHLQFSLAAAKAPEYMPLGGIVTDLDEHSSDETPPVGKYFLSVHHI